MFRLISIIAVVFLCIACTNTPEEKAIKIVKNEAEASIADSIDRSKEYQDRVEYALQSNWAVSRVKASKVEPQITVLDEVEPGIYKVEVEILCVVTYKAGPWDREKGCGRTNDYLVNINTGELVQ